MRLKIKQVHPSPEIHQQQQQQQQQQQYHHQENYVDQQQIMKKEIVDEQEEEDDDRGSGSQWLKSEEREQQPSLSKSGDTNTNDNISNHNQIDSLPNSSDVPTLGKRKRKPRELLDQISPIIVRRRRKKSIDSKALHQATPNSEGKSTSKQEKADDGSSIPVQKSPTLIRAEELQSSLGDEYPTFVKLLGRSHIGSCFRMGLPVPFCKSHLPKKEAIIILQNENGEQFEIRYIAEKTSLGAGWRKFVSTHKLVEGDVICILTFIEDSKVSVMDPEYFVIASEAYYKDIYIKHLETSEIEEALATMTEPGGGGSPMSSSSDGGGSDGGGSDGGGSPMSSDGGGSSSGGSPMSSSSDGSD